MTNTATDAKAYELICTRLEKAEAAIQRVSDWLDMHDSDPFADGTPRQVTEAAWNQLVLALVPDAKVHGEVFVPGKWSGHSVCTVTPAEKAWLDVAMRRGAWERNVAGERNRRCLHLAIDVLTDTCRACGTPVDRKPYVIPEGTPPAMPNPSAQRASDVTAGPCDETFTARILANGDAHTFVCGLRSGHAGMHESKEGVAFRNAIRPNEAEASPRAKYDEAQRLGPYRVGSKLGRTLYRDDACIGMVDDEETARFLAAAANCYVQQVAPFENAKRTDNPIPAGAIADIHVRHDAAPCSCDGGAACPLGDALVLLDPDSKYRAQRTDSAKALNEESKKDEG